MRNRGPSRPSRPFAPRPIPPLVERTRHGARDARLGKRTFPIGGRAQRDRRGDSICNHTAQIGAKVIGEPDIAVGERGVSSIVGRNVDDAERFEVFPYAKDFELSARLAAMAGAGEHDEPMVRSRVAAEEGTHLPLQPLEMSRVLLGAWNLRLELIRQRNQRARPQMVRNAADLDQQGADGRQARRHARDHDVAAGRFPRVLGQRGAHRNGAENAGIDGTNWQGRIERFIAQHFSGDR